MKKLTSLIIEDLRPKIESNILQNVFAVLFSLFSIIFSLSIIIELEKNLNGFVFIITAIFIVVVLVFTEYIKVKELIKFFKGVKSNLFILVLTHVISIGLSGIGIYFFTDKTVNQSNNLALNNQNEINSIQLSFQSKKDSILNLSIESNFEFQQLSKSLLYWKSRKASDISERAEIRNQIKQIESNLISLSNRFNESKEKQIKSINGLESNQIALLSVKSGIVQSDIDKNVFVSSILIALTILIKIFVIYMAYLRAGNEISNKSILSNEEANRFKLFYSALKYFYAMKGNNITFYMNEFSKDIPLLVDRWESDTKYLIKFLINHKIIKIDLNDKASKGKILMSEKEALDLLCNTYNVILTSSASPIQ